jgi:hypothetical protein
MRRVVEDEQRPNSVGSPYDGLNHRCSVSVESRGSEAGECFELFPFNAGQASPAASVSCVRRLLRIGDPRQRPIRGYQGLKANCAGLRPEIAETDDQGPPPGGLRPASAPARCGWHPSATSRSVASPRELGKASGPCCKSCQAKKGRCWPSRRGILNHRQNRCGQFL